MSSLKNPTSMVLIAVTAMALTCASLLGGELYWRQHARSILIAMVECMVDDDADVSIATPRPLLLQAIEGNYTDITIATAGKQVRSAEGMRVVVDIRDLHLQDNGSSAGTIGSLSATIEWTDEGMKRTAQQSIPLLSGFVTGVTTDPSAGTIALESLLGSVTAKPTVADGGMRLQIENFTGLGWSLPGDGLQSAVDAFFATGMKEELPTGLHIDELQVQDSGVAAHLSARNLSIPATRQPACTPSRP